MKIENLKTSRHLHRKTLLGWILVGPKREATSGHPGPSLPKSKRKDIPGLLGPKFNNPGALHNRQSALRGAPSNQPRVISETRCSRVFSGPNSNFPATLSTSLPRNTIPGNSSNSESPNQLDRLQTPERGVSQENQMNYSVNRQLAM